jgi:hypothetical protein
MLESRSPSRPRQRTSSTFLSSCRQARRQPTHPESHRAHRRQPDLDNGLDLLLRDWTLSDQHITELFSRCKWPLKRPTLIPFVQWVIKHMVANGEQRIVSGSYARGTASCGGYKQQEVVDAYVRQNVKSTVTISVWANTMAPSLTALWNFAVDLKEQLQQRSYESDGSAVDCSVPAAGRPAAAAAGGGAPDSEGAGAAASISGSRGSETAADGAATRDEQEVAGGDSRAELRLPAAGVPGSPPLAGSSNEGGGGSASEVCGDESDSDGRDSTQGQDRQKSLAAAEALVEKNSREMASEMQLRLQNAADTAPPLVLSSTSAAGGGGGGVGDSASASLDSDVPPPPPPAGGLAAPRAGPRCRCRRGGRRR